MNILATQPKRNIGWGGWVLGLLTALLYADLAATGFDPNRPGSLSAPILLAGATSAYMHARFNRSGWAGFGKGILIGTAATIAVLFLNRLTVGFMERRENNQLAARLVAAAAVFEPSLAIQLDQAKSNGSNLLRTPAEQEKFRSAMQRALQVAPAAVLLAFDQAKTDLVNPTKGGTVQLCSQLARGSSAGVSASNPIAWAKAMTSFFEGAAHGPHAAATVDADKSQELLRRVLLDADPDNVFGDEAKLKSSSDENLCNLYIKYTSSIHSLPAEDAADLMRYVMQVNDASLSSKGR